MESINTVRTSKKESGEKTPSRQRKIANFLKGGLSFGVLRGVSNATWIGGTAASIAAQEKMGVPWQVAAPAVGISVASIEMYGSKIASRIFKGESSNQAPRESDSKLHKVKLAASYVLRESVGLGYSAWAGAMSAVEFNSVLKLESNQKRRAAQSTTYGLGVAAWSLPVTREPAIDLANYGFEHPLTGGVGLLAGSLALYASMEGAKKVTPLIVSFFKDHLGISVSEQTASIEEPLMAEEVPPYMIVSPKESPVVES